MGVFAICDSETDYLFRLMEYLDPQISQTFQIHAFSNGQSLIEYGTKNPVEILLISNQVIGDWIHQIKCKNIILLSEGEKRLEFKQNATVYKYQSAQEIFGQVMYWYAQQKKEQKNINYIPLKEGTNFVGFYSPWSEDMQTSLAMSFGNLEGKENNTLYLNLKGYHGFSRYMNRSYQRDLSDLMYFFKSKRDQFTNCLASIINKSKDLDYIPPMENPMNIKEVTITEWLDLLEEIRSVTKYETIILDLTDEVNESLRLLEKCSNIYVPISKEKSSEGKMEQLNKTLIAQGKHKLQEKLVNIVISQETIEDAAMIIQGKKKEGD